MPSESIAASVCSGNSGVCASHGAAAAAQPAISTASSNAEIMLIRFILPLLSLLHFLFLALHISDKTGLSGCGSIIAWFHRLTQAVFACFSIYLAHLGVKGRKVCV